MEVAGGGGPLSSAAAQVALLWLPTTAAALRQLEPKWRPAVEDWASETQTYVFSYGFLAHIGLRVLYVVVRRTICRCLTKSFAFKYCCPPAEATYVALPHELPLNQRLLSSLHVLPSLCVAAQRSRRPKQPPSGPTSPTSSPAAPASRASAPTRINIAKQIAAAARGPPSRNKR